MENQNNIEKIYRKSIKTVKLLLASSCIIIVIGSSFFIFQYFNNKFCKEKYEFINANLVCQEKPILKKTGYAKIQSDLEHFITIEKQADHVTDVAIYFRDLKNGPVFGINETDEFAPASLLKLPIALVYFTQAEKDPDILNKNLVFNEGIEDFNQTFKSGDKLVVGSEYKTEDLIMRMLKYSDNDSYAVLIDNLLNNNNKKDLMKETFLGLGFIAPEDAYDQVISVRRYGSIFRALYNSSILNSEDSEKILSWLSNSEFTQGIVSGLPKEIKVSHKFGERFTSDGKKQLHDCGIIYFPENPYLLCIMTKGNNYDFMSAVIREISKEVYIEVDSRRI